MKKNISISVIFCIFTLPVLGFAVEKDQESQLLDITHAIFDDVYNIRGLEASEQYTGTEETPGFCQILDKYAFVNLIATKFANQLSKDATEEQIEQLARLSKTTLAGNLIFSFAVIKATRDELVVEPGPQAKTVRVYSPVDDVEVLLKYGSIQGGPLKLYEAVLGGVPMVKVLKADYKQHVVKSLWADDLLQSALNGIAASFEGRNQVLCP